MNSSILTLDNNRNINNLLKSAQIEDDNIYYKYLVLINLKKKRYPKDHD